LFVEEVKAKICLIGDNAVGKTSLIKRFVLDIFDDKYISTMGIKITKKNFLLVEGEKRTYIVFSIWDVMGQKEFKAIQRSAFSGSNGFLVVCDMTNKQTLDNIDHWISVITETAGKIPFVIMANKSDMTTQLAFGEKELEEMAMVYRAPYFVTSAKTGVGVSKAFEQLAILINGEIREKKTTSTTSVGMPDLGDSPTIIDVEDRIIIEFCALNGGIEVGKPIIREQIRKFNINFASPSKADLIKLTESLNSITTMLKGQEITAKQKMVFGSLLAKIP
jgi:small GTP-binding protein